MNSDRPCRIIVLISGNGSNLQAIIDSIDAGKINGQIVAVISNRSNAYGLERAQNAGIPTEILLNKAYADRNDYDLALMQKIDHFQPDLVVLAGFMRILTTEFVNHYLGRMLNIHPSLLPKYKGLNTHQRVIDAGEKEHGATVHFVTPELDSGPVVLQETIRIQKDETAEQLASRIHQVEHKIYPEAVSWFADSRLHLDSHTVLLDNQPITM